MGRAQRQPEQKTRCVCLTNARKSGRKRLATGSVSCNVLLLLLSSLPHTELTIFYAPPRPPSLLPHTDGCQPQVLEPCTIHPSSMTYSSWAPIRKSEPSKVRARTGRMGKYRRLHQNYGYIDYHGSLAVLYIQLKAFIKFILSGLGMRTDYGTDDSSTQSKPAERGLQSVIDSSYTIHDKRRGLQRLPTMEQ